MNPTFPAPDWRRRLAATVDASRVQHAIIALILINAAILGLETSPAAMARWGPTLTALDQVILAVFVVEIAARMTAHGLRFFRDPGRARYRAAREGRGCRIETGIRERCRAGRAARAARGSAGAAHAADRGPRRRRLRADQPGRLAVTASRCPRP